MAQSKLKRLEAEGIVDPTKLTDEEKKNIRKLSSADVDYLIKLKKKVGHPAKGRHHAKPNCFM